jgi:transposase
MDAIVECCAGLDVHQATVVACVNNGPATKRSHKEVRTFGTTRVALEEMRDWLAASGCTLVAMESTGIYWHPVYAALEGHFELVVGNAQHIKNVPGRKTDVKDCEWIRDLTRYRRKLSQVQASERNRLIKLLESANPRVKPVDMHECLCQCRASGVVVRHLSRQSPQRRQAEDGQGAQGQRPPQDRAGYRGRGRRQDARQLPW